MTIKRFPSSKEMAYRKAVAEWRKIMKETPAVELPKDNVDAAVEEMARYWVVLNSVPDTYNISVERGANVSYEEGERIAEQIGQQTKAVLDPYVEALNYSKQIIYELVLQKHGAVLNYEPGMID